MNTRTYRKIQISLFLALALNTSCNLFGPEVTIVVSNSDKGQIFINDLPMSSFVKSKYSEVTNDTLYFLALPRENITFKFIIQDSVKITKIKKIQGGEVYLAVDFETLKFHGFE